MDVAQALDRNGVLKQLFGLAVGNLRLQRLDLAGLGLELLGNRLRLGDNLRLTGRLKFGGNRVDDALGVVQQLQHAHAGGRFDSSDTGRYRGLGDDLDHADLGSVGDVGAAAELDRVAHGADADDVAVLLAEQRHRALVLGLGDRQLLDLDRMALQNHPVDLILHLLDLLLGHRGEVAEVEAAAVLVVVGTGLMDVGAQHLAQRQLQQVADRVVGHDAAAAQLVDPGGDGVAGVKAALLHNADVHEVALVVLLGVLNCKDILAADDDAGVAHLAAGLAVEGGLVEDDGRLLALLDAVGKAAVAHDGQDRGLLLQRLVAGELGRRQRGQVDAVGAPAADILSGLSGADALLVHQAGELLLVDGDVLLGEDLAGQVDRETKGVIETEGVLAGELSALAAEGSDHLLQLLHALVDGLLEALLLGLDDLDDVVLILAQLRISALVFIDDGAGHLIQESALDAEQPAVAGSAAQQPSQDIAAALVGGQDAVADHEGGGADVVGNDAQRDVGLFVLFVLDARDAADVLHDVLHRVHLKEVADVLHDAGQALQTHAGVDVRLWHAGVVAVAVRIKLGEDQVPDLHIAVAVAADLALGASAAALGAAVKVDLRAGAAGTGAVLPEVVLLAEADDALGRDADLLDPDLGRLVVLLIDRNPQLVRRDFQHFSQKLPRPGGGLYLKVVAEGKVAQHLKVGAVAVVVSNAVDVRSADALLTGGDAVVGRGLQTQEVFFQWRHAGVDEQQALVIFGHQRSAWQAGVALALKEGKELLAQIVESCPFHRVSFSFFH